MSKLDRMSADAGAGSLRHMRVLLVEDTWIIAQSYADLLIPLGIDVIGPAVNLHEANRLLSGERIDAALVDMNLQGEMADSLVESLHRRNVPVVIVTGYEVLPSIGTQATAVLTMPIRAEQLIKTLRGICAAKIAPQNATPEA